jgi:uncharacterized protein (DUF1499 family)
MNYAVITWVLISLLILFSIGCVAHIAKDSHTVGVVNGKLHECPNKPNCINTEYANNISQYLPPLAISNLKLDRALLLSKEVIIEMGGEIIKEEKNYLAAKFTSKFFSFVDDFEIRCCDRLNQLHIRSAARIGYSDFGVNKRRVEKFSNLFKIKINKKM